MTINGGASKLDAPPFPVHRILSIEMINPNPSPHSEDSIYDYHELVRAARSRNIFVSS